MNNNDLNLTRKKIAIIFTLLVFFIVFLLEIVFFSIKFYNINYIEKRDFNQITTNFYLEYQKNPLFLNIFLDDRFKNRNIMMKSGGSRRMLGREQLRFVDFVILDKSGNIVIQNVNQEFNSNIDFSKIDDSLSKYYNGFLLKKIDIKDFGNNYDSLIFIKKQNYQLEDYFEELFYFLLINIFFSIIFYYLGLYFAGKNLKPIENILNDMIYFIHNANHELKTPISVISSNLQIMKATKTYEQDLIDNSIDEIKRIDNLIIGLSKLSDINIITTVENLDLNKEIKNILEEFRQNISEKNIKLNYEFIKNTKLKVNKDYFYIMFSNLLRNAIKYNISNGKIEVILDKNKLIIRNTGPGISKQDLPKIFDRFYKGEKGRNTPGFGIGLSLVKKICDIYNWEIVVKSIINQKTTFEINFK